MSLVRRLNRQWTVHWNHDSFAVLCVFHHPHNVLLVTVSVVLLDANHAPPVLPEHPECLMHFSVPLPPWGTVTSVRSLLPFFPSPVEFCCGAESALETFSPKAEVRKEDSSHIILKMKSRKSWDSSWLSKTFSRGGGITAGSLEPFCTAVSITEHCIRVLQQDPADRGMGTNEGKKTPVVLLLHPCLSKYLGLIIPQYFLSSLLRNMWMRSLQARFGFCRYISHETSLVYPCTTFLQSASLSLRDTLKRFTLY